MDFVDQKPRSVHLRNARRSAECCYAMSSRPSVCDDGVPEHIVDFFENNDKSSLGWHRSTDLLQGITHKFHEVSLRQHGFLVITYYLGLPPNIFRSR